MNRLLIWTLRAFTMFVLLWAMLALDGCSPQKRMERILRKNPDLAKVDSVVVHDTIQIAGIDVSATIEGDTSSAVIDSLIRALSNVIPDTILEMIAGDIRYVYKTKAFLKDTVVRKIGEVTVRVWQSGTYLGMNITKPPSQVIREIKVPCPALNCKPSKWQKFWIGTGRFCLPLLIIIGFAFYLYARRKS